MNNICNRNLAQANEQVLIYNINQDEEKIKELENNMINMQKTKDDLIFNLEKKIKDFENNNRVNDIKEKDFYLKEIENLKGINKRIEQEFKENINETVNNVNQLHNKETDKLNTQIEIIATELQTIRNEKIAYKEQVEELKKKNKELKTEIKEKERKILKLDDLQENFNGWIRQMERKLGDLNGEIEEIRIEKMPETAQTKKKIVFKVLIIK